MIAVFVTTVEWTARNGDDAADGRGDDAPPLEERYVADEAVTQLEAVGFVIETVRTRTVRTRPETFAIAARR